VHVALAGLLAGVLQAAEYEVLTYPVITVEIKEEPTGMAPHSEEIVCQGVLALPLGSGWLVEMPPQGYAETKEKAELAVLGKTQEVELVHWKRDESKGYPNHNAREIMLWESSGFKTPSFQIPLRGSEDLPIPPGCVGFHYLPVRGPRDGVEAREAERAVEIRGEYTGEETVTISGKEYACSKFSYTEVGVGRRTRVEMMVSSEIPGHCYLFSGISTGTKPGSFEMRVKAIEESTTPEGLVAFPEYGMGCVPPPGWKEVATEGEQEAARWVLYGKDGSTVAKALSIEVAPSGGKSGDEWFGDYMLENQDKYGLSGHYSISMGDRPTFVLDFWPGAQTRARAFIYGCENEGRIYTVSLWLPDVPEDGMPEDEAVKALLKTWRWVSKPKEGQRSPAAPAGDGASK